MMRNSSMKYRASLSIWLVATLFAFCLPHEVTAQSSATDAAREAFRALLDGATLEGQFTVVGADGSTMQRDDLYSVSRLKPGEDEDTWVFEYRMSYGGNQSTDVPPLEIPVRVLFPDGTPLLTMSQQEVPGLGTFSVRLVFHGDRYAGMWQNGPIGGHMWGVVRQTESSSEAAKPPAEEP